SNLTGLPLGDTERAEPVSIETVTARSFADLDAHLSAWDDLASRLPQQISTVLPSWTSAFLRHRLKPHETWLCSFAYADGKLIGVLPLIIAPHNILGKACPLLRTVFDW